MRIRLLLAASAVALVTVAASAQVTAAAGYTPPDDTPSFKVGATIFGDFTYQDSPSTLDADGHSIHPDSFNVSRAYINITGNLNHWIGFRITPDISRETGSGASLAGSQEFRLKYAYAQFGLDDWMSHGSWVRFGVQQTPYVDYTEGIYRYRFQGQVFAERVGLLTSSDAGVSGRYALPGNYGDVHAGFYNGEGYSKAETNNEKAFQIRGTIRPLPLGGVWKGLRLTAFVDEDHYVSNAKRQRYFGQATFEHRYFTLGAEYAQGKDQTSATKSQIDAKGWSVWATPRFGTSGWEMLLRHDDYTPNKTLSAQKQKRNIIGLAYWIPRLDKVTVALMLDYDSLQKNALAPPVPDATNYAFHMLLNF